MISEVEDLSRDAWVVVAEQTTDSVCPEQLVPVFPAVLVLGGERSGVSSEAIDAADAAVYIPMVGMANSLNVATTAAILLYLAGLCATLGDMKSTPAGKEGLSTGFRLPEARRECCNGPSSR